MRTLLALAALVLVLPADEAATLERGRELWRRFLAGEVDELWAEMGPELQGLFGEPAQLGAFREQVEAQLGPEVEVVAETAQELSGLRLYTRRTRHEKHDGEILVQWSFDAEGVAQGFQVRPAPAPAPSEYLDYETKTPLRLPFDGTWTVFWGGRTIEQNYHAATRDQRFAYDLVITEDGSSHRGEGKANEDYHCWKVPILAPAAGKVVVAVDGIADNVPGQMNPHAPPGNHVVLDHGDGELSLLAHFVQGTVAVEVGQEVQPGQRLGLCGNSGNSSEPHLHYHLQTGARFGAGDGLPAQFLRYEADGELVERGEPVQGQRIRPAGER